MSCEIPKFDRCFCCMPLRQGITMFGCINIILSGCMIGMYFLSLREDTMVSMDSVSIIAGYSDTISGLIYFADIVFNFILIYATYKKNVLCLTIFYYYILTSIAATVTLDIIGVGYMMHSYSTMFIEIIPLVIVTAGLNAYLALLVRSLMAKLQTSGQSFENQLQQFVNGELKEEGDTVNFSTVTINETP